MADFIKKAIELEAIDSAGDLYGDDDDLSRDEYIERDKGVLLYMKKHPEIRKIVEEQIGVHIPQELRIRSRGTERHSASN